MKSENQLISVVVPIYNVEKELERCVESLLKQTYTNLEIILVDDGSTDRCPQICDEYLNEDGRVLVIHKKNGGLSDARNEGLIKASGKYVMFVDSDDYLGLDACEKLCEAMQEDIDFVVDCYQGDGKYQVIDGEYKKINE